MISNQEEFDRQVFVANLAIIYMALYGKRRKHEGLERKGERKEKKTQKKPQ